MRSATLIYLAAAIIGTWPLALHPVSLLGAPAGPGDPYLNVWILGWGMQTWISDPGAIFSGRVFDANIFHPAASTLAYSDHLLLQSLAVAPLYAITRDAVFCYNVLLLASLVASALAMYACARSLTGSHGGALLAGLAWGFWSYRFAHLLHLQLQSLYWLPLSFLLLHRVMAGRRTKDAVLLGLVLGLQAISSVYYAVIGGLAVGIAAGALAIGIGRWRSAALARQLLLAALIGAALVAPIGWVYWRVQQTEGFGRNLFEASRNATHAGGYLHVPPGQVIYGRTGLLRPAEGTASSDGVPRSGHERELFPGLVLVLLAAAGAWRGWRSDARPLVIAAVAIGAAGFVLSLGPDGARSVYAAFHRYVFGFQAIRAPARFAVLVTFALALLAALGWREIGRTAHGVWRLRLGPATGAFVLCLAAIEYLHVPLRLATAPPGATAAGQWLAREPAAGAVLYLPLQIDIESTPAMVESLQHRRPLVNGYSGQRPAFYAALVDAFTAFPSAEGMLALRETEARFVVSPAPLVAPADLPWPLVERARFPDSVIYEVRWTPELEERLEAAGSVTPPPTGPVTFGPGERAQYDVSWSGAGDVVAGHIVITVRKPSFTFEATAETAPWVARFFEAQDRFTTYADESLLPRVHERDQNQGSRRVARTYVYDQEAGVVRVGRTEGDARASDAVVLPLARDARDALTALFFLRTLRLVDGERYLVPVNDGGRNVVLEVRVEGRESITVGGRTVRAVRVRPALTRRVERRAPVSAMVWMADDSTRVPLRIEVESAFGRIIAELSGYQGGVLY